MVAMQVSNVNKALLAALLFLVFITFRDNRDDLTQKDGVIKVEFPFVSHARLVGQSDSRWMDKTVYLSDMARSATTTGIAFYGDSITEQFALSASWATLQKKVGIPLLNFGVGGDRTQHLLYRLENGNLDFPSEARPVCAFLLIGTNNSPDSVEGIAEGVNAVIDRLQSSLPSTVIFVLSLTPRGRVPNAQRAKLASVNNVIKNRIEEHKETKRIRAYFVEIDWTLFFLTHTEEIDHTVMHDFLHFTSVGYKIFLDVILQTLQEHGIVSSTDGENQHS